MPQPTKLIEYLTLLSNSVFKISIFIILLDRILSIDCDGFLMFKSNKKELPVPPGIMPIGIRSLSSLIIIPFTNS